MNHTQTFTLLLDIATMLLGYLVILFLSVLFSTRLFRYTKAAPMESKKNRRVRLSRFSCDTLWPDTLVLAGQFGHSEIGLRTLCSGEGTVSCQ